MDLTALHSKLLPCDMESPFVFVSYCSKDKEVVWSDVIELQDKGYNIWIDEANLDKRKPSWKNDALEAISNFNCEILLFFVSKDSLTSEPCYNELEQTKSDTTLATHNLNPVSVVAIEVEQVGDIASYMDAIYNEIRNKNISGGEKGSYTRVLSGFKQKWFLPNNEKVRIHAKNEAGRLSDYYSDIESVLSRCNNQVLFSQEKQYRFAVSCLIKRHFDIAVHFLKIGERNQYLPASLLLAHILYSNNGKVTADGFSPIGLWKEVDEFFSNEKWMEHGLKFLNAKYYSEALAYLLGYGERNSDPEALFYASQIWVFKGCYDESLIALKLSASFGSDTAKAKLPRFSRCTQADVEKMIKKDETPV